MIIYNYTNGCGIVCGMICRDDGPIVMTSNTGDEYAYNFVYAHLEPIIKKISVTDKRLLDVGMGNGNVLRYARKLLDADVFGYDIKNYLYYGNYIKDRTFPNTDIRDMPKELLGTFDMAYQRYFSVPFKDTGEVLLSVAKALKPNGIYYVTFSDDIYEHEDSFIFKVLNELYNNVVINKGGCYNKIVSCLASEPRINPVLTPMDKYYYTLNDEEYKKFTSAKNYEQRQMVLKNL